jgi:uncharacterized protein (TIGR00730 family)
MDEEKPEEISAPDKEIPAPDKEVPTPDKEVLPPDKEVPASEKEVSTPEKKRRKRAVTREELIAELHNTVERLERDKASRGDLKILSRTLRELRYSFRVFSRYRQNKKITVFGSARTQPDEAAYQHSVEYGRLMAEAGWMVLTGAGGGIMEGAHVGSGREMAMGVNIMLPFEQEANYIIRGDKKLVNLKYFFTRKLLFVKEVHAVALFPGGFGTQDEGFETLTLLQTGKRDMMPIVCIDEPGGDYWLDWKAYIEKQLLKRGLISPEDLSLFLVTDDVVKARDEVLDFYRVYHSMRYVRDRLVLRLQVEPSDDYVEKLNDEYQGLLAGGEIEKSVATVAESDEVQIRHLPRLKLKFNRRNLGKLRQMIDQINEDLS